MNLFTEKHREHFARYGYTLVEQVLPTKNVQAALSIIREYAGFDLDDPATWYRGHPENVNVVPLHHPQAFWDNRQHPCLHQVFAELWGTEQLWVTMDRATFLPPARPTHPRLGLHWDIDPRIDAGVVQALVYLTDTPPERGAFLTVPAVWQQLDSWLARQPVDFDFTHADFSSEEVVAVPGRAGDVVIWHPRLPHGPGENTSSLPRVMQAITMFPVPEGESVTVAEGTWTRAEQISWWREKRPPPWWRGLHGQQDPEPGEPARLTALGRKLIGLERW